MDYRKIYFDLMKKAKYREIKEGEHHHIWPRSLGGSNYKENIVLLSYREHFIAHKLLVKFLIGEEQWKMMCALNRFIHAEKLNMYNIKSRDYEKIKKDMSYAMSKLLSGRKLSEETKKKQSIAQKERYKNKKTHWFGNKHKDSTKELMRQNNIGDKNPQYGKSRTEDEKKKISNSMKGIKKKETTIIKFKKMKWINNGFTETRRCDGVLPEGFIYGRL